MSTNKMDTTVINDEKTRPVYVLTGDFSLDSDSDSDSDVNFKDLDNFRSIEAYQKINRMLNKPLQKVVSSEFARIETPEGSKTVSYGSRCVSRVSVNTSPMGISSIFKTEPKASEQNKLNADAPLGLEI